MDTIKHKGVRLLIAVLAAKLFLPGIASAKKTESGFRSLTDKEKQIFVPFLCDVTPAPDNTYDASD